jgi:hypothetical protein
MAEKPFSSGGDGSYFNSFNCVDVFVDEPGDTTVRPCDPKMLEHAKAERAKILAAQAAKRQPPQDAQQG